MKQDETISAKQAAALMKRSVGNVYRLVSQGKLGAMRVEGRLVLQRAEVCAFRLQPRGRPRTRRLCWRRPTGTVQGMTILQGRIREEAHQRVQAWVQQMQHTDGQLFPGQTACYLTTCAENPSRICLLVVWSQVAPSAAQERQAAISALQTELAPVVAWDTEQAQEQAVLLHAY